MDAKELRIGNWVAVGKNKQPVYVIGVVYDIQKGWLINGVESEFYSPIELSVEIIKKCGFEIQSSSHESANYKHYCSIGFIDVKFTDTKYIVYHCVAGVKVVMDNVKCLHQIQNLHYAFTGEDLQIEL